MRKVFLGIPNKTNLMLSLSKHEAAARR